VPSFSVCPLHWNRDGAVGMSAMRRRLRLIVLGCCIVCAGGTYASEPDRTVTVAPGAATARAGSTAPFSAPTGGTGGPPRSKCQSWIWRHSPVRARRSGTRDNFVSRLVEAPRPALADESSPRRARLERSRLRHDPDALGFSDTIAMDPDGWLIKPKSIDPIREPL